MWHAEFGAVPAGAVVLLDTQAHVVIGGVAQPFGFGGWGPSRAVEAAQIVAVLTPRMSVAALAHGYIAVLHPTTEASTWSTNSPRGV